MLRPTLSGKPGVRDPALVLPRQASAKDCAVAGLVCAHQTPITELGRDGLQYGCSKLPLPQGTAINVLL